MYLAIDSTQNSASLALGDENGVVFSSNFRLKITHSETLVPALDSALKFTGIQKYDLTGVLLAIGPGSFTGLRIGLSTAKGLALGLQIPIYAYDTLELAASRFFGIGGTILSVVDAKMNELYAAVYDSSLDCVVAPCVVKPDELPSLCVNEPYLCGTGLIQAKKALSERGIMFRRGLDSQDYCSATDLFYLHRFRGKNKPYDFTEIAELEPLYLRESTAQIRLTKV